MNGLIKASDVNQAGHLQIAGVDALELAAKYQTPLQVFDVGRIRQAIRAFKRVFEEEGVDYEVSYASKAFSCLAIYQVINEEGGHTDVVSGGELWTAMKAGFPVDKVSFHGNNKTDAEIKMALYNRVGRIVVDNMEELDRISRFADELDYTANIQLRIKPGIDAHTHHFIMTGQIDSKFGFALETGEAMAAVKKAIATPSVQLLGLDCHIGSQILDVEDVYATECSRVKNIVSYFEGKGLRIAQVDLGGGLGVDYMDPDSSPIPDFETWFRTVSSKIIRRRSQSLHLEPGRSIVAQCGTLVSRVLFVKVGETKNFLVLDAGMNDMIRPALYGAYHRIENLSSKLRPNLPQSQVYDVVGPVCESSDVWGMGRLLPLSVRGDLIAICSAGAYGQSMSNRYNLRDLAPAVYSDDMHGARLRTEYFQD